MIAKPDAMMDELKKVCDMACIREEIENTENGFDTIFDECGIRMSGGQKQYQVLTAHYRSRTVSKNSI